MSTFIGIGMKAVWTFVQELESAQAMNPLGVPKGVYKLSRLPTVTLLLNNDVPATAVDTTAFPQ